MSRNAIFAWLIVAVLVLIGGSALAHKIQENKCEKQHATLGRNKDGIVVCVDPNGSPLPR